ncbi:MAG: hypothetical protein N2747_00330 [Chitinophagaceae bacterium]|nr:hypothetical protein [Chitinophagaceae bacterium]
MNTFDLRPIIEFFQNEISPLEIAKILDEAIMAYISRMAKEDTGIGNEDYENIFYLRAMRNVLLEAGHIKVFK